MTYTARDSYLANHIQFAYHANYVQCVLAAKPGLLKSPPEGAAQ